MKYYERYSACETSGGKYSSRKIPKWRIGHREIQDYLDTLEMEADDSTVYSG